MLSVVAACTAAYCSPAQEASRLCHSASGVRYIAESRVLCIDGELDEKKEIRKAVLSQNFDKDLRVVIRSPGGYLRDAIDITLHLEKFGYDVIVDGICASACAQFIFFGAENKYIINNGVVAVHGGPMSDAQIDALDYDDSAKRNLKNEQAEFIAFYKERKIELGITRDFPERLIKDLAAGQIVFWIPKEQDYQKYGVKNIRYCDAKYRDPDNVK